jgi:hypothetical protein
MLPTMPYVIGLLPDMGSSSADRLILRVVALIVTGRTSLFTSKPTGWRICQGLGRIRLTRDCRTVSDITPGRR